TNLLPYPVSPIDGSRVYGPNCFIFIDRLVNPWFLSQITIARIVVRGNIVDSNGVGVAVAVNMAIIIHRYTPLSQFRYLVIFQLMTAQTKASGITGRLDPVVHAPHKAVGVVFRIDVGITKILSDFF